MTTRRPDVGLAPERTRAPYARDSRDGRPESDAAATRGGRGGEADVAPRDALRRATRRGVLVIGAAALIGCLQVTFMILVELDRTVRHTASIAALEAELDELAREAAGLRAVEEHARDDVYREQLARAQGFMYPGETRVVVLPSEAPPVAPVPPTDP